jgi:hypothetical protein
MEAISIGVHGFVAKPIAPAILYRHIGEILERQDMNGRSKGITGLGSQKPTRKLNIADVQQPPGEGLAEAGPEGEDDTGLALL